MAPDPLQALQAANRRPLDGRPSRGALLIAGATGALGHELVRRLAGRHRFDHTYVLAREPIRDGLTGVETVQVPTAPISPIAEWPPVAARTAVVLFEPPRLFYDRERALWTPEPAQLPALAAWLRSCGVQTLAVVMPHEQGRLPEALKRGLASLDEQAVVSLGFERVLLVRSAQSRRRSASPTPARGWPHGCCRSRASWCRRANSRHGRRRWPSWSMSP